MIAQYLSVPILLVLSLYCPAINLPNDTRLNIPLYDISVALSFLFFKILLLCLDLDVFKTPRIEKRHM